MTLVRHCVGQRLRWQKLLYPYPHHCVFNMAIHLFVLSQSNKKVSGEVGVVKASKMTNGARRAAVMYESGVEDDQIPRYVSYWYHSDLTPG